VGHRRQHCRVGSGRNLLEPIGRRDVRALMASASATAATGVGLGCLVLIGVGLVRRTRPALGWSLIASAGLTGVVLGLIWDWSPALTILALTCMLAGVELDARGHRPAAVLSLLVGLIALGISLAA
jgi:hypothetical protein